MNPKKLYIACFTITMLIFSLSLYNVISYYSKDNQILESTTYTDNSNLISVYIENEDGDYVLSETSNFAQGTDYVYNEEKSYCVNESVLSYNTDTSKISVTASGTDNCYVYFDYYSIISSFYLAEQIIINNAYDEEFEFSTVEEAKLAIESKDTPDFSTIADEDEGIFATEDNDGTSYYFRGATEDNYVEFAGMLWRIIRIDGQGNIKLMLFNEDSEASSYSSNISSSFNSYSSGDYINGYAYDKVNDWFTTNLLSYQDFLVTSNYCVESTDTIGNYYSIAQERFYDASPTLECDSSYELYSALISMDEVMFAGGTYSTNTSFYLYTTPLYWTITAFQSDDYGICLDGSSPRDCEQYYSSFLIYNGNISYEYNFSDNAYIFPTISLSAEITDFTGSGIASDPYVIITE